MIDFSQFKKLTIGGVELKELFINGIQVWKASSYTNQIQISTDASGAVYNGKGWKENTWVNGGNESYNWGTYATGFIPCKAGDVIRLQGVKFTNANNQRLSFFDSNKGFIKQVLGNGTWYLDSEFQGVKDADGNYIQWTLKRIAGYTENCAYIRVTSAGITNDSIITVNQEIA